VADMFSPLLAKQHPVIPLVTNIDAAFVVPKYLIAQFSNKKITVAPFNSGNHSYKLEICIKNAKSIFIFLKYIYLFLAILHKHF
jgi:hypothetical protein